MAQYVYTMQGVSKTVPPKRTILENISLSFFPGAKIGVLGLNGSGKSSLLRIMAGVDTEFDGEARAQKGINVGYLPQEPQLDESKDVRGNVEGGLQSTVDLVNEYNAISDRFAEPMDDDEMTKLLERQGDLATEIDACNGWDLDRQLEIAADALRLPAWDAEVSTLSGGERRRVALCKLLLSNPDMLLLDEPTNHLDAESVAWLERFLDEYPGTVVAVTHDRYFLDNVAEWILELDRGQGIPWKGNYTSWLEQKESRMAVEEKQNSARAKTLQRELEWARMAPRARQSKGKARLNAYEELLAADEREQVRTAEILIPKGPRLGKVVIQADDVKKGYGEQLLVEDLTFVVPPAAIVGIIGANGAGKTTLFRMITGQEQPDEGSLEVGETVKLAYVDQSRDALDPDKSVYEEVTGGADVLQFGRAEVNGRAYLSWFNFRGPDQQKKVGVLSGGERNRLHLAKLLKEGGNVMLLDEPTNDLDVDTLRALEDAILDFAGCVLVISHDRWFRLVAWLGSRAERTVGYISGATLIVAAVLLALRGEVRAR